MIEPYHADPDVTIYCGDEATVLRELPAESVQMAVTSPPFFGLRDYGVEGQIGLEASPAEWAARLVEVFAEVRRVLRQDGTLWVECGDSYAANRSYRVSDQKWARHDYGESNATRVPAGLKPKDLLGAPFLLAFALRDAGWYWRGCYIWHKPNPMPESVRDRCTVAHSYVLHFAKRARYYHDPEAIAEPADSRPSGGRDRAVDGRYGQAGFKTTDERNARFQGADTTDWRNARSVWTILTEPLSCGLCRVCRAWWPSGCPSEHCGERMVQHFAAFP